jgi:hypothetical protein
MGRKLFEGLNAAWTGAVRYRLLVTQRKSNETMDAET